VSIWATIFGLEDNPAYRYEGSHILPHNDGPRDEGAPVQLAEVPSHITRDGRDDRPEDGAPWPWMRLSVGREDVVLDRGQVLAMWESMGAWLEELKLAEPPPRHVGGRVNAEDCPACRVAKDPPPYPFICPGEEG
jgi:hypothetical protein